ncbi:YcaO-like family protein [Halocatena halophila]|uniref:YcaO-like family protein n=1 Tax=Halocatena halophila TaxID=2814576 RepID=UPI002ED67374
MTISIVGGGVPADSVVQSLTESGESVTRHDSVETIESPALSVIIGSVGDERFERASEQLTGEWIALELGGVGGIGIGSVAFAVTGFGPKTPCFDCLHRRVDSQIADDTVEQSPSVHPPTAHLGGALAGTQAVKLLDGDDSPLGAVLEQPHATRRLLAVPGCSCTDHQRWMLSDERLDRSLEESLERAERAVDPRLGIISEVGEIESFPVPYYLTQLGSTTAFSSQQASKQAAGVALDWNEAFMKALGESLERYCAGVYKRDGLVSGRPVDQPNAVVPSAFVHPGDHNDTEPIEWVPGTELGTDRTVSLPAEHVFFPYDSDGPTITTGLGLGNDHTEAIVAGLTEIIERDAAIIAWYSSYEPLGLSIEDERFGTLRRRAKATGLSVTATLLTQDVDIPVVAVAVHRSDEEWPAFALGLAADLDPIAAAVSAGTEAIQNFTELRRMGQSRATEAGGRIGHFAARPATIAEFVSPDQSVPITSVAPEQAASPVDLLLDRLHAADLSAYATSLTTVDVRTLGFEAVRVLVPSAQPLFIDSPYFGDRARTVPKSLGFDPRLEREHHPYP